MKEHKQKIPTNPFSKSKFKFTLEIEKQQTNSQNVHPQDTSSQDPTQKGTAKSHWTIIIISLLSVIIIMILAIVLYKMNPDLCMSVIKFFEKLFDFLKSSSIFERCAGCVKLRIFTECLVF